MRKTPYIGVIGAGTCSRQTYEISMKVGKEIGKKGWRMVCGGLGGVMEGAAKGCLDAGGITIGILPGFDRDDANPYIAIPLPTGLSEGRNLLVIRASDIIIAISGGYGTLSEIGLALKAGKAVIGLGTWQHIDGVRYVSNCEEAFQVVEKILENHETVCRES